MNHFPKAIVLFFLLCCTTIHAQVIDVQHYRLDLTLNDSTDVIDGKARIFIRFTEKPQPFQLDLTDLGSDKKGMKVSSVTENGKKVASQHSGSSLKIQPATDNKDLFRTYEINYQGIPADGLIIAQNLYGDRTFFGDNWPNRAHNWFPCVDHPSDKATFEFIVTAPDHYQVVANGVQVEETNIAEGVKLSHWKTNVAIPTKVAVIGVARFAIQYLGEIHDVPVSSWVYPQNRENGFYDYAIAEMVLDYFIEHLGPYPYGKIANVQSKTRFGGMENASNIFYFEQSVTGKRDHEDLIAHELAHQWFGNSATETDWAHLWLSEGFATYFTDLYIEHVHGRDAFVDRMLEERGQVIAFSRRSQNPVVDTKTKDYMKLLNPNSYQKGAWVLHMLRHKIGDDYFWQGVRNYYQKYALSNASTEDFQQVMETASGQDLDTFFIQWLYTGGNPILQKSWTFQKSTVHLDLSQVQKSDAVFQFPLTVKVIGEDGKSAEETVQVTQAEQSFDIKVGFKPLEVVLDPDTWLLFEEN